MLPCEQNRQTPNPRPNVLERTNFDSEARREAPDLVLVVIEKTSNALTDSELMEQVRGTDGRTDSGDFRCAQCGKEFSDLTACGADTAR